MARCWKSEEVEARNCLHRVNKAVPGGINQWVSICFIYTVKYKCCTECKNAISSVLHRVCFFSMSSLPGVEICLFAWPDLTTTRKVKEKNKKVKWVTEEIQMRQELWTKTENLLRIYKLCGSDPLGKPLILNTLPLTISPNVLFCAQKLNWSATRVPTLSSNPHV